MSHSSVLTLIRRDVMFNILEMKNWYDKNEKALEKLISQQQQLIAAKNAVFGIGADRGIQGTGRAAYFQTMNHSLWSIVGGIQ